MRTSKQRKERKKQIIDKTVEILQKKPMVKTRIARAIGVDVRKLEPILQNMVRHDILRTVLVKHLGESFKRNQKIMTTNTLYYPSDHVFTNLEKMKIEV